MSAAASSSQAPGSEHTFAPPPSEVIDPDTRAPRAGSYEGPLPAVDYGPLARPLPYRVAREKAWYYVAVATPDVFFGVAILRFGYVASTFAFAFERGAGGAPGRLLADRSQLAPPFAARYSGDRGIALGFLGRTARFERSHAASAFDLEVELKGLRVAARVSGALVPPPISAIADLGGGLVQATEKRALLPVQGELEADGRRFSLDGGFAGFDRSHGYLRRHTEWRWAYLLGRADSGEPVGINLVEGFVGTAECAVWVGDKVYPVGEGRFVFDRDRPLEPWRVTTTCGSVDLRFEPGGIHAEHQNLGLVRTRFLQPAGAYSGTVTVGGKRLVLTGVLGVAEDQDALW